MKFLREDFGESNQLDDFVNLSKDRFNKFYQVIIKVNDEQSERYFAYESAAKDYYDKMLSDMKNDVDYYENSSISIEEVIVDLQSDELESFSMDEFLDSEEIEKDKE